MKEICFSLKSPVYYLAKQEVYFDSAIIRVSDGFLKFAFMMRGISKDYKGAGKDPRRLPNHSRQAMTNTSTEFAGRVALITGGSRGIGRAICLRLARAGAWVAINHSASPDAAADTLSMVRSAGGEGSVYQADVACYDAVDHMIAAIERDRGPVSLLVANAGIASYKDDRDMPIELWRQILSVNLDGTFHCFWRVKQRMIEQQYGRVVCISSINGISPSSLRPDRLIAYGTSKSAVIGFARNCAVAFGPEIRVNCVAPGLIETEMTQGMSAEMRQKIIEATPVRRVGEPADVAELTYFLLSDAASFITGQTYLSSGGLVTLP